MSVPIFVFEIRMPIKDHQSTLALEGAHELCYTHIRWNADKHMYVIWTCFRFDDFHFHFPAQFSKNSADILF